MIPIKLIISGFLSYLDPVEIDFTSFDLACISGSNGAGKSSLLDAITWSLFGQARKRDDALVNSNARCDAAEVVFIFAYEGNLYRVRRALPRGKTSVLEFNIYGGSDDVRGEKFDGIEGGIDLTTPGVWKALTAHTQRETQDLIKSTLRMDYDTFINASFFLQGKADQFTQLPPGERKRILSNILGLEIWNSYRELTAERRKAIEAEITNLDGRLVEINSELAEEGVRKARLGEAEESLKRASSLRHAQEKALDNIRKVVAALAEQRKLVENLARQVETLLARQAELRMRFAERQGEQAIYDKLLARADVIRMAYAAWQNLRAELERWEGIAGRFREHEKRRQEPLLEIETARARLLQEKQSLEEQGRIVNSQLLSAADLDAQIQAERTRIHTAEVGLAQRKQLENELVSSRQRQADARAHNPLLKRQMDEIKAHKDQLEGLESPTCPFCGQPLSEGDRLRMIGELQAQGTAMGDQYRLNQAALRDADKVVGELENQISALSQVDVNLLRSTQILSQHTVRLEGIETSRSEWEGSGAPRLAEVSTSLEQETYATEARRRLREIDAELLVIGYDAATHDAVRQAEAQGRTVENELRELEKAQATLVPLEREISDIQAQLKGVDKELEDLQREYTRSAKSLASAEAEAPDLDTAEVELLNLQEQENRQRLEVGATRQKVDVLEELKVRRKNLAEQREVQARLVGQYKQLERAFGKDGIPALLIEQALPQIEARANDILERLSGGKMNVRFETQAAFKDKKRDELRETLDIKISDSVGTRDYELFSGGEAFRVNFAIRLALSEVLAQRAGARLQTLVIDEGFGSQDAEGRQRLVEAINLVKQDFAKVLVITHIDELKEAFPVRIEVEKTERGSKVRII